jgi:PAS domain S-box-containing protein
LAKSGGGLEAEYPKARLHLPRRILTAYSVLIAGLLATIVVSSYLEKTFLPYTLTAGIIISLLLYGLANMQTRARAAAESFAERLQTSEATVRTMLADRERAEKALKESEERYRDLVENANDIVYTMDLNGNLTSINKAAELITGHKRPDLLSKNLGEFITPESMETTRQMLERKLLGEERTNYEMEFKTPDGRELTLEISSKLMLKEGQPSSVQGIARDITTRRRAEESLRQADQRALSTYERLLDRVSGLAQMFGTARDLAAIFRALKEFTLVSVPCQGLFVSLYDPARDMRTAVYGWADDVELDTSQLPPMPVTASGPNSRAVRTNQVVITSDYMEETRGHPAVLVGPDNGLRPQSSLAAPMSLMGRVIGTIEVQTYDRDAYSEEHATAMRMAANLAAVAIENVRLLERESTARAAAEESNRLKDEFLATVSHELRTPLTAILGWSRMLESGLETEMAARAIETIKRNAKAQAQIIDDILDVSRIITGNLHLELHPIELAPVLESAINVVRPTAEAKGIQIESDLEREPAVVSGDVNRLQQVFWNLLSNAVKFTPAGGKVTLSVRQLDSEVELEITDTGQGIEPGFLPFVFDRFRQADSTSTRQHGGLGLGLAIARQLIEIHGGHIGATSDGAGKGATFRLRLPLIGSLAKSDLEPNGLEQAAQPKQAEDILAGIQVLVVDDDVDTLELLTAALRQRSATVTAVSSAAAAMDAIMSARPHVLISDIAMPGEDGYDLIRKVIALELAPKISVIAITAYAKDEDRERALLAGFQRYLSKPVELGEFISAVAEAAENNQRAS